MKQLFCVAGFFAIGAFLPHKVWSGDYLYVTNTEVNLVSIIDAENGLVIKEVPVGMAPADIVIDRQKRRIAISHAGRLGEVWILELTTFTVEHRVLLIEEKEGRGTGGFSLAFTEDGKRLYAVNENSGLLYMIDAVEGKVIKEIRLVEKAGQITGMILAPDGRHLYISDNREGKIYVVDTLRDAVVDTIRIYIRSRYAKVDTSSDTDATGRPMALSISPDGKTLYVTNTRNLSLDIIELSTKKLIKQVPAGTQPTGVVITGDLRFLFVTNKLSYSVTMIDMESKEAVANIPVGAFPIGIAISPDGGKVYVCNYNESTVSIIDVAKRQEVARVATPVTPTKIAIYSP